MRLLLKPTGNRVLIEPILSIETTRGGLIVPESTKDDPSEGVVVSIGPGKPNRKGVMPPIEVQVGDRVLFNRYEGQPFVINRKNFKMFELKELLAIID